MTNQVTAIKAAVAEDALAHFSRQFSFETDCWDVHDALQQPEPGFILLDVRSKAMFDNEHIPGAISLPHGKIIESKLAQWPADTLFIAYCAGPHCNGAARAAVRLASFNRPVKIMAGGITGWKDEGFALTCSD